jgi:hypothetical protein
MKRELTEAEKAELEAANKMRQIMRVNTTKQTENGTVTPKVEYASESVGEDMLVKAWLQKTFPTGDARESEVMLFTQRANKGQSNDTETTPPDLRATTHGRRDVLLEYEGFDKTSMPDDERIRLAQNVIEALNLVEKVVRMQPTFELVDPDRR